jgi:hypothetical protein
MDGAKLNTSSIAQSGNWIFVYITPNCAPCSKYLHVVGQTVDPGTASRVVVIVGGATSDKVAQMSAGFSDLSGATWYADPGEGGVSALQINAIPTIFGAHGNILHWSIIGIPSGDSARLKTILKSWIS